MTTSQSRHVGDNETISEFFATRRMLSIYPSNLVKLLEAEQSKSEISNMQSSRLPWLEKINPTSLSQPFLGRIRSFFSLCLFRCIRGPSLNGYRLSLCTQSRRILFQSQDVLSNKKWSPIADRSTPFLGLQIMSDQWPHICAMAPHLCY